ADGRGSGRGDRRNAWNRDRLTPSSPLFRLRLVDVDRRRAEPKCHRADCETAEENALDVGNGKAVSSQLCVHGDCQCGSPRLLPSANAFRRGSTAEPSELMPPTRKSSSTGATTSLSSPARIPQPGQGWSRAPRKPCGSVRSPTMCLTMWPCSILC